MIAVYGYYQAMSAKEHLEKLRKAVAIIELITAYYFNENLYVPLADYYVKLNEKLKAIAILNAVLNKNPGAPKAASLLAKLKE